ncbi:MAG TPA: hypothetical protein VGX28_15495 [Frankiaceae bacterium]|nr:hypothetical protein [Frankiaceae bacterium]
MRRARVLALAALTAAAALSFAPPASACVGLPCDAVNAVCEVVRDSPCVR